LKGKVCFGFLLRTDGAYLIVYAQGARLRHDQTVALSPHQFIACLLDHKFLTFITMLLFGHPDGKGFQLLHTFFAFAVAFPPFFNFLR
jgi:hypothetical protein